jgi:hypothetical protein
MNGDAKENRWLWRAMTRIIKKATKKGNSPFMKDIHQELKSVSADESKIRKHLEDIKNVKTQYHIAKKKPKDATGRTTTIEPPTIIQIMCHKYNSEEKDKYF